MGGQKNQDYADSVQKTSTFRPEGDPTPSYTSFGRLPKHQQNHGKLYAYRIISYWMGVGCTRVESVHIVYKIITLLH